jgi:GDP-L-fucose synthase
MLELSERVVGETVNVGAGRDLTIREFAEAICAQTGCDSARVRYDTSRYTGAQAKLLRVEKLRRLLPELRLTPLEEGLRQTIAWAEGFDA